MPLGVSITHKTETRPAVALPDKPLDSALPAKDMSDPVEKPLHGKGVIPQKPKKYK